MTHRDRQIRKGAGMLTSREVENVLHIPSGAMTLMRELTEAGYKTSLIGGCVRDAIRAIGGEKATPHDFDVTTSAMPSDIIRTLGFRHKVAGMRHGTVLVVTDDGPVEVTTYRSGRSLRTDMLHRDFTINSIAMTMTSNGFVLCDPFGGVDDIRHGIIRCVNDPVTCFDEDPLRIMRAVRFASTLGYSIDGDTKDAIGIILPMVNDVALERTTSELLKTLRGGHVVNVLTEYRDVLFTLLPELRALDGLDQHSRWHAYDAYGHTLRTVDALESKDDTLLVAALLHDCAKPDTMTIDENGNGHFYGHDAEGADKARDIMRRRLCLPSDVIDRVCLLIRFHEFHDYTTTSMRRLLRRISTITNDDDETYEVMRQLLVLRHADIIAHGSTHAMGEYEQAKACDGIVSDIRRQGTCISTHGLAIDGNDVMSIGIPQGPKVGKALRMATSAVADGMPNEHDTLLALVKSTIL